MNTAPQAATQAGGTDLDQLRAEFEALVASDYANIEKASTGAYLALATHLQWLGFQLARRASPQPVAVDEQANIKPWRERVDLTRYENNRVAAVALQYAENEIAELRAALTQHPSAAPSAQIADASLLDLGQQAIEASDARQSDPDAPMKAAKAFFADDHAGDDLSAVTVLRAIIHDGYLSDTNMARGRSVLDRATQPPTAPVLANEQTLYALKGELREAITDCIHFTRKNGDGAGLDCWKDLLERFDCAAQQAATCQTKGADLLPPMGIYNDRDMLNYLMVAFDNEIGTCERCGHSEPTKNMDSAGFLRDYLAAAPTCQGGAQNAAEAVDGPAAGTAGDVSFHYYGLSAEQLRQILDHCLKPDEIAGSDDVQHDRVRELVWWFARLTQGNANPKWAVSHACELAYFVATNGINRNIDLEAVRKEAFKEGVNITPDERGTLERIGFATPRAAVTSAAGQAAAPVPVAVEDARETVLTDKRIDQLCKPWVGLGGVENQYAFARAIEKEVRAAMSSVTAIGGKDSGEGEGNG